MARCIFWPGLINMTTNGNITVTSNKYTSYPCDTKYEYKMMSFLNDFGYAKNHQFRATQ